MAVDRFDYSTAIADSWKQQTLLNIVKLRYMDLPVFVDVASIVSGYSIESSGNIGGQISSAGAIQGNSLLLGAVGMFTDRPTIPPSCSQSCFRAGCSITSRRFHRRALSIVVRNRRTLESGELPPAIHGFSEGPSVFSAREKL